MRRQVEVLLAEVTALERQAQAALQAAVATADCSID